MKQKTKVIIKKYLIRTTIVIASLALIILAGILSYLIAYKGRIYPNISVAGVPVAGNTEGGAALVLSKGITTPKEITLTYMDQTFSVKGEDINLYYDFDVSGAKAYAYTRDGNMFGDIEKRINLFFKPQNLPLSVSFDQEKLDKLVSIIAGQISIDPIDPSVTKSGGSIIVTKGTPGREVDQNKLIFQIMDNLSSAKDSPIEIPVEVIGNTINDTQANALSIRAGNFIGKGLTLKFEYTNISVTESDIFKLLSGTGGYNNGAISLLIEKTAPSVERDPQNPKFTFENGKVTEFQPALDGVKIDRSALHDLLIEKLNTLESGSDENIFLDIPVIKDPSEVSTGDVNDFGIKELIGRGTSTYFHSIPGRVHNVALATSRINGTLVKPGDTFSFNQTLGDVSAFTGYKQAYIITDGKTILGDGGGVCQVSTTLFRALLNAGLPISERQAHAYRVGYYEQDSPPGMDATVFSPSPDLKFTNDTGHYILIEAKADSKNYSLVFELYGTKDGRVASVSKPVVTNVSAPPPDVYQDDPTIPTGTVKQVDYKAWGAKVTFHYVVTKDGSEIVNKTFISNYKPWAAVYLRGTGPAI